MKKNFRFGAKKKERIDAKVVIEQGFDFLITSYGFHKDANIASDPTYAELRLVKNGWSISVVDGDSMNQSTSPPCPS